MKYFSRELMGFDDEGPEAYRATNEEFERCLAAYEEQLDQLRPRLSAVAFEFFRKVNRHDATLLNVTLGDDIGERYGPSRYPLVNLRRMRVRVRLLLEDERTAELSYSGLRDVAVRYSFSDPWFWPERPAADDLLVDEICDAGGGYMVHEYLFSSGTSLRFEFQRVACRLRGRRRS